VRQSVVLTTAASDCQTPSGQISEQGVGEDVEKMKVLGRQRKTPREMSAE